jgi:hypothetical protein
MNCRETVTAATYMGMMENYAVAEIPWGYFFQ